MAQRSVEDLLANKRVNTLVGWLFVVFLAGAAAESFLEGDIRWGLFVSGVVVLCLVVPVAFRDLELMLPWEVIALAALPTFVGAVITNDVATDIALYVSVAALALIVAVQLDLFTQVRMTVGFAIAFVVLGTLATAGVWAVFRWSLDVTLGTNTLLQPGVSDDTVHDEMMLEFLYSAVAGVGAGIVFEAYFRRESVVERFPEETIEEVSDA